MCNPLKKSRTGDERLNDELTRANLMFILRYHGHQIFPPHPRMTGEEVLALVKSTKGKADKKNALHLWLPKKGMTIEKWIPKYFLQMFRERNYDRRDVKSISGVLVRKDLEIDYLNDIFHAAGCGCDSCWGRMSERKDDNRIGLQP